MPNGSLNVICDKSLASAPVVLKTFNSYLHVINVVTVPGSVEELVSEAHDENVLDHLLTQVVVNTEDLLLLPVGLKGLLEVTRTLEILAEGLLDL